MCILSILDIQIIQDQPMQPYHPKMPLNDEIYDSNSQDRQLLLIDETYFEEQFNEILSRLKVLEREIFHEMQQDEEEESIRQEPRGTKNRRKANQIVKKYQCGDAACSRRYGSRSSAKNHVKIKHKIPKSEITFDNEKDGIIPVRFNNQKTEQVKVIHRR